MRDEHKAFKFSVLLVLFDLVADCVRKVFLEKVLLHFFEFFGFLVVVGEVTVVVIFQSFSRLAVDNHALLDSCFLRFFQVFRLPVGYRVFVRFVFATDEAWSRQFSKLSVHAFGLEFLDFFVGGGFYLPCPASRVKAICFRFVLEQVRLACAALFALQAGFVLERCLAQVLVIAFQNHVDEILVRAVAAFELALEHIVGEVCDLRSLGKLDDTFLDLLQHLVARVCELLAHQDPAERAAKMLRDYARSLFLVGKGFDCNAFFIGCHAHAGYVLGKRDFVETFGVLAYHVARDLLQLELLCGRKPAETSDNAIVSSHADVLRDGDGVDDAVRLDRADEIFDVVDFADVVAITENLVYVDGAEAVRTFFRLRGVLLRGLHGVGGGLGLCRGFRVLDACRDGFLGLWFCHDDALWLCEFFFEFLVFFEGFFSWKRDAVPAAEHQASAVRASSGLSSCAEHCEVAVHPRSGILRHFPVPLCDFFNELVESAESAKLCLGIFERRVLAGVFLGILDFRENVLDGPVVELCPEFPRELEPETP